MAALVLTDPWRQLRNTAPLVDHRSCALVRTADGVWLVFCRASGVGRPLRSEGSKKKPSKKVPDSQAASHNHHVTSVRFSRGLVSREPAQ